MKTPLARPNAMSRIRVFLIATCIIAVTPRLSGDIILVSRLSEAKAAACGHPYCQIPPPQTQTGFLPANLRNSASGGNHCPLIPCDCGGTATSTSNSTILINDPMEGLRVVGDGTASQSGCVGDASAKLIVLSFTLTDVAYPYSMTGQLDGASARATLTGETVTIFDKSGTTTLSESGTLPPGNYTLSVELYAPSSSASFTFVLDGTVSTPRVTNLSTRMLVGTGDNVGIGGFVVTGSSSRHLLLRGTGPSLAKVGVPSPLADPAMELHGPSGFTTVSNDNWRDTQEAEIIATGRVPSNDLESAIVADLAPGAYTAFFRGNANTTGVGLLEIFDLSKSQVPGSSRQGGPEPVEGLTNISTRGNVGTGGDIMIAGFIVDGGGGLDAIIARGLGPSLAAFGIPHVLVNPELELRDINGGLIRFNNNWMDDPAQAALISAAGLAPGNTLEAAIVESLSPGTYTALLSGRANLTGIGMVEVYDHVIFGPTPTPVPTPTPGPTPTPRPGPSQITSLSTRMMVKSGDGIAIVGFIACCIGSNDILLRGLGPSLAQFGVTGALADPVLELHSGSSNGLPLTNNDWRDTQEDTIIWTGRAPSNDLESAIFRSSLNPGAYTAFLAGNANTTGVGLFEIYDYTLGNSSPLRNISTRAHVGTGEEIAIGGFILGGGGGGANAIILRGLGPSLTQFDVPDALADPKLELRDLQGALIASDDNWIDDPNQAAIISESGLAPTNNLESAIAVTLMPGNYTVLLSGVNDSTGVGLVEVYDRGAPAN